MDKVSEDFSFLNLEHLIFGKKFKIAYNYGYCRYGYR